MSADPITLITIGKTLFDIKSSRDQAKLELEKIKILVYKYEGAIESTQILIDEENKKEEEKKKSKK